MSQMLWNERSVKTPQQIADKLVEIATLCYKKAKSPGLRDGKHSGICLCGLK